MIQKYLTKYMIHCIVLCGLFVNLAYAEDEESAESAEATRSSIYVPIIPAFVVNYGGPGNLKYIKLEVSLRVKDTASSNSVRHHMPLIRDYLVREFSRLDDVDVDTQQGKELVRIAALEGVQALLFEEEGDEVAITGLYFNNFVVQR